MLKFLSHILIDDARAYYKKGQLYKWEREIIEHLRKNGEGQSYREIGKFLERDHSVISREIARNGEDKERDRIIYTAKRGGGGSCLFF
ncbi:MAG: helix-turn-helix domain-containing protein [Candidatus Peribacteria bacterium]|nr:helix-turn-helix domain-containing protein [Candidatus Peribacteria bacterium]